MNSRILLGDVLERLRDLPDESVHCVVTSPPYWGLRDYGTAAWEGGTGGCDHRMIVNAAAATATSTLGGGKKTTGHLQEGYKSLCGRCGAQRVDQQIGLEKTPEEFVAKLVAVFREVRRVLRADGTCWVNMGDSYAGARTPGLKNKDMVGMPWRLAFALQADGWWLRQDIIWAKPNPMPESVTDRCTKSHEYIFLLTRSERYHYDANAVREEAARAGSIPGGNLKVDQSRGDSARNMQIPVAEFRNKRSVWNVATEPFSEAHFATFPTKLVEPCILAGCPLDGTVLDPFNGAGTTGLVAQRLGRGYIGIELNPEYAAMAERRIRGDAPMFSQVQLIQCEQVTKGVSQ